MNKHLLTFLALVIAVVFYFVGMTLPAAVFIILGMLAELVFWVRLFKTRRGRSGR